MQKWSCVVLSSQSHQESSNILCPHPPTQPHPNPSSCREELAGGMSDTRQQAHFQMGFCDRPSPMGSSLSQLVLLTPAEGLCDRIVSPLPPAVSLPNLTPTTSFTHRPAWSAHTQIRALLFSRGLMTHPRAPAKEDATTDASQSIHGDFLEHRALSSAAASLIVTLK